MEKMGWSKGKGLGKDEQGDKDHISVRIKDNTKGLGYKGKDDEWIKHYEGFEEVLATLNSENNSRASSPCSDAPNNEVNVDCKASKHTSLEALSKNSNARLHYKKFTRGKDLSQLNLDDIECITGSKRAKQLAEIAKKEHFEEVEVGKQERASGITTIKGGNIQDYFAKKMAMLNSSVGHRANTSAEVCEPLNDEYEESQMHEDSKKGKKKRKTEDAADVCEGNEKLSSECDESKKKKKKSKKEKGVTEICEGNENSIAEQDGPEPVKKKKYKEKDVADIFEINKKQIPECDETKRNKKKKKKDVADSIEVKEENIPECDERERNQEEITEENGVAVNSDNTKKIKKKRKKDKDDADICKSTEDMLSECDEIKENRKKRKKAKDAPDTSGDIEGSTSEGNDINKNKKRKKEKDATGTGDEGNLVLELEGKLKKKKKSKQSEKDR
ncbi:PIN2/TERF1-interacting telomerase inhibitor 1-like isoform X2 [Macrobrachium nipponense]